ncbi:MULTISPECIES: hypothetical protein [unclassified Nocardioides]|uniref:hypothetical protein n=1 Tax=unclassified Nocardioides TaxID=2615069 RepID=UPI0000571A32|nr:MULTISPECIES: hypothetical protein [unclassified Nocardioides]ABL83241.1 hypothetical protein Noca_3741 [Nocardioides sp. JS614]MBI2244558.1 hypothetical protein [Nocardioides sp.]
MSAEDYCELCDLPKSQCIHGNPPAPPPPTVRKAPATRPVVRRTATSSPGSSRSTTSTRSTTAAAPARPVRHRWTPPDVFKPEILAVLSAAGGELDQDEVFLELEVRMEERLTDADHEKTPEGELRWRYAARRARQALVAEGAMTKGRPGIWALG